MKKRVESGDYRVCAAHDVAPVVEKALGISPKDLKNDRQFMELRLAHSLRLPPDHKWSGLKETSKKKGNKEKPPFEMPDWGVRKKMRSVFEKVARFACRSIIEPHIALCLP